MPITLSPITPPSPIDLTTGAYVAAVLSAGGTTLTAAQDAVLGSLLTAASREIIRFCGGRLFGSQRMDEFVVPEGYRYDRGEPATAKLAGFPIVGQPVIRTGRTTALTVTNTDRGTNQYASVAIAYTGEEEFRVLTYTGLILSRTASGATTTNSLTFATYTTVGAMKTAINALGGGWSAALGSSGGPADISLFPSSELVGALTPQEAFSPGASLDLFAQTASGCRVDRQTGILSVSPGGSRGGYGNWGYGADDWGYEGSSGLPGWPEYRCTYSAGFATVPENLQLVTAEVVQLMLNRLAQDSSLKSETTGKFTWVARDVLGNLSDGAMATLNYYKDWKV
jgi:hypothetical protein